MATQPTQVSILREFCPLYYLLNAIPAKVQRGFRTVVVYLTALDSSSDFIAVGSSIGMLYLYCRRRAHMNKYSLEGKSDAITAVKILSCFDDLVAVGTASGHVIIFQLVSPLPGRNKQLRRYNVVGLHKGTVTALAWSTNGMKLFSGDDKGRVVFTSLDLVQGVCNPVLLLEESASIVQLDYSHQVLLVSTLHRSLLYCTQKPEVTQLGSKPRKSSGRFGACFLPALCKQSDLQVFAARPGLRLWRSDIRGQVEDTRLLKPLFNAEFPQFELFPRPDSVGGCRPPERQLGLMSCFLKEAWILSWNEYSVYVLDCVKEEIVGALESSGDIVSVSCSDNEIFILKGDRDIIRLSDTPEGLVSNLSDLSLRLTSPMTTPTIVPPSGLIETAQPIRTMAIIVESEGKEGAGLEAQRGEEADGGEKMVADEVEAVEEADEQEAHQETCPRAAVCSHSRSSSLTSWDSLHGNSPVAASYELVPRRYSGAEMEQELVVKAIRVKKKKRQRQDSTSGNRLSESSDSKLAIQDDTCSEGGSGTPLSDRAPFTDMNSQDQDSPTHNCPDGDLLEDKVAESSANCGSCPPAGTMLIQGLQDQHTQGQEATAGAQALTPDVDLLLECTFSYLHNDEKQEMEDELLSPLIGPEEEEEDELDPPSQMFYSTVSHLDRKTSVSSEEEADIYAPAPPQNDGQHAGNDQTDKSGKHAEESEAGDRRKPVQLAESWMGYSGPGCGILSLQVTDRYVWCLDFKGGLFCSPLPETGLNWQRFEDNVHQMALSPSGNLLWKVEQKTFTAYACAKVSGKGKRHWYKAVEQSAFVALSDDSAWIIRTNGDMYLQTGLSVDRPCARSVKVDTPCVFSQVCVRGGVVWALSEHKTLFYREGLNSYCSEGDSWKSDTVSEAQGMDLMCIALGDGGTAWALDSSGSLWFRTGICSSKPQGDDDHWWQISISDYVVFDQGSLFQTLLQATHSVATVTRAPVERVVAFLSQYSQCQPSLVGANSRGVWVASGRNQLHLARGSLVGTFWQNVVPRGTISATRWTFITSSRVLHREGAFLWLAQSRKDLFCVWDQDGELRPSSVSLPPEVELTHLSACHDALWGLDTHGRVSIRTLTQSCPIGLHWTLLDLSQLGNVRLVSVSCGSQNVWAVDHRGAVYFRVGTQPLNPSMMLPAWIQIEPPVLPVGVQLLSIHTSPNDTLLWAVDNRGSVFVRTGLSEEMPVGTNWDLVPGLVVTQLVLSCRTVWVRCVNGDLARRYGVSQHNPAGDYWKKIPGTANWLTVTPDDELWAVDPSGGLSRRLTKLLPQLSSGQASSGAVHSKDDVEDEWELI
ncbi:tectonin beta-propeller repeat-containing protein 2 [Synchiropus splendidus]|uniref:tectonin beta-propeller repeat-containing protein 2 n=1 Tax=Synchiropus splendidus TaxID=270530 RepID=UPI00237DD866|nr:tectonin beta-propeller repeat-containing protein 2 [Synchiropus splendidus]XP_053700426.1 tectonin beta-propeller repeat-containing protein 2 [Synchiropus splendidus]XP_053700427.1 tectonin beta-propeller repeat-containing protein 2 [Synchiropus splendidus]XP_053700428.1 tectonin beta-propeller repeat-containing protein 2 [Synchiropus splendidus]XP_053700429.1 tectonin beta-propeller repeat-containing protein 2 [Synchiropus splendidus]